MIMHPHMVWQSKRPRPISALSRGERAGRESLREGLDNTKAMHRSCCRRRKEWGKSARPDCVRIVVFVVVRRRRRGEGVS